MRGLTQMRLALHHSDLPMVEASAIELLRDDMDIAGDELPSGIHMCLKPRTWAVVPRDLREADWSPGWIDMARIGRAAMGEEAVSRPGG